MALSDKHPEFINRLGEYIQMADTYAGQRAVKAKRLDYLPASEGMVQDGMQTPNSPGWRDYEAYLERAYYHDGVKDAVKAMIGILHNKPATISLPNRLSAMMERATTNGEGLQMLLRRINVAQFVYGRCGVMADAPIGEDVNMATPYLAFYDPLRLINWDAGQLNEGQNKLQLVVLDEGGYRREGFTWKTERKYRILALGAQSVVDGWTTPPHDAEYAVAVKVNDESMPTDEDFIVPQIGGQTLNEIPFVFIGANDLAPEPETPPLLGLSNLCLAIYRQEADYRQTLYLQGQQTLVIVGGAMDETDPQKIRTGAKGVIELKIGGEAKYIGVSADGLGEMRQSLTNDKMAAAQEGVQFLDVGGDSANAGASGEALRIRVAARTTTLSSVARAAGQGLENILKICAVWVGEDPATVSVVPTTDFADQSVQGAALLAFMQAKQLGLPLSLQSLHRMMQMNDMTEKTFDEENDQIEAEAETLLGTMVGPMQDDVTDDSFLDGDEPVTPDPNAGAVGAAAPTPGAAPAPPASTAPPNNNVPIKPSARSKGHTRGSPVPLKVKVGRKGASAGK